MATALAQTTTGTALAARDNSEVGHFTRQLEARAKDIQMALPHGMSQAKFQRTVLTAVAQNPDLLTADRQSLILSCYKAAQDGLLPDGREAAFVTFNQRFKDPADNNKWKSRKLVQYMPMVYGLRKKILQAKDAVGQPIVSALQVGVVYKAEYDNGYFRWERGSDPEVQHRPMLEITEAEAADDQIVAAYSIATMSDGTKSCEVMRRFEIDKIRQMSQTGATGRVYNNEPIEPKGPWVDWYPEMAKKTVMRRHAKTLPMSGDVIAELGGDDDEILAARSSALALGGTAPDAPALITDESGDTIDTSTGEVNAEQRAAAEKKLGEMEAEFAKAKTDKAKAKIHERYAQWISELEEPFRDLHERAMAAIPSYEEPKAEQPPAGEPATDEQTGVTKHPAEAAAERLLGEFAHAKTESALTKLWSGSELDRAAMPDDIHEVVTNGYNRHLKRVGAAQTEPAQ